jgi:hypothetical protein
MQQDWMIVERLENWEADQKNGFSFFGLSDRYRNIASQINKGDKVFCYVSSAIGAFSDIRVVRDSGIKQMSQDTLHIYNKHFAFCFTTSPLLVLPRGIWVPLSQLLSTLELTKDRAPPGQRALFQTSIRRLSTTDGETLEKAIRGASSRDQPAFSN